MTELYLQKSGGQWQRVWFETSGGGFKMTRENPYFTQSENYTLDVTLPMDILDNRQFFQNLQRMDRSKQPPAMKCRLLVDSVPVLNGSAKVTQVTERQVKVQLLGGRSEVNFLGEDNGEYVDELPLGSIPRGSSTVDTGIRVAVSPVINESSDRGGVNGVYQFCLVDLAKQIISHYGFTVTECSVDVEPWNCLYVATAKQTRHASHVLPHWSPREFFTEFCNFFNVVLDIDETNRTVAIVTAPSFFAGREGVQLEPLDEYTSEISDDGHALAADNLSYDLSSSAGHDYDCVPENIRLFAATEDYASKADAQAAYEALSESARKRKIFKCPVGKFAGWDHDYSDWGDENPHTLFTQIDVLAPLTRASDASETSLKICPVAIAMGESVATFGTGDSAHTYTTRIYAPSIENPTGNDTVLQAGQSGIFGGSHSSQQEEEEEPVIQDLIEGDEDVDSKAEKEDRLQVMFIDDVAQTYSRVDSMQPDTYSELTSIVGFTDWQYKKSHRGNEHRHWSLSLNPTDAAHYLGELHQNGFSFNMKAKLTVKFISDTMPDPTRVYIIRNKRYGCEKIEASINEKGFDRLMTGYFYEFL